MDDKHWNRWLMQTARTWEDIAPVIKETGISPVDHDHRQIVEYILELNELLLHLENNFSLELVDQQKKLLDKFLMYTRIHFHREELFLEKYDLPGLERQKEEHKNILVMLDSIIFEFNTGRISSAFKLRLQLLTWIVKHINTTDYEVFDFLNICEALLKIDSWDDIQGFIRNMHIPPIDHDHKLLTEAIMKVGRAIQIYGGIENASLDELILCLEDVLKKTVNHFKREEKLIARYSVPGSDIQKGQHKNFVQYLKQQKEILIQGNIYKLEELERELLFWWIQHINIYDYTTFCKNRWINNVFTSASCAKDVMWLISQTGIMLIDNDHAHFVELIFDLRYIINPEVDHYQYRKECLEEMNKLINYASFHFRREEDIMKKSHSDILERHRKEHNKILHLLSKHLQGMEKGLIDLSGQLRDKLLHWWIDHTNGIDFETFGVVYEK